MAVERVLTQDTRSPVMIEVSIQGVGDRTRAGMSLLAVLSMRAASTAEAEGCRSPKLHRDHHAHRRWQSRPDAPFPLRSLSHCLHLPVCSIVT